MSVRSARNSSITSSVCSSVARFSVVKKRGMRLSMRWARASRTTMAASTAHSASVNAHNMIIIY